MIKLKLEKSVQNLLKTTEAHTEKGKRSMSVTFSVSLHGTSGTCLTRSCVFSWQLAYGGWMDFKW